MFSFRCVCESVGSHYGIVILEFPSALDICRDILVDSYLQNIHALIKIQILTFTLKKKTNVYVSQFSFTSPQKFYINNKYL